MVRFTLTIKLKNYLPRTHWSIQNERLQFIAIVKIGLQQFKEGCFKAEI